jgi:Na+/H+ antiporter NhaD/arsenite permease-like protein
MIMTMGSAILSVFIDNVPYNIAMVWTLEQFQSSWLVVWSTWYALAWWLNSCTSIWWAWSPIWAACNVIALWEVEEDWIVIKFLKYLIIGVPLVMINSYIAYLILDFRYL